MTATSLPSCAGRSRTISQTVNGIKGGSAEGAQTHAHNARPTARTFPRSTELIISVLRAVLRSDGPFARDSGLERLQFGGIDEGARSELIAELHGHWMIRVERRPLRESFAVRIAVGDEVCPVGGHGIRDFEICRGPGALGAFQASEHVAELGRVVGLVDVLVGSWGRVLPIVGVDACFGGLGALRGPEEGRYEAGFARVGLLRFGELLRGRDRVELDEFGSGRAGLASDL